MELIVPLISLPAIAALILKAAIYAYTRLFRVTRNIETRLFLFFLLALVAQNIAEIAGIYGINVNRTVPYFEATMFYASLIAAIAFLFHLAICLAYTEQQWVRTVFPLCVYGWAVVLVALAFSHWLIQDFVVLDYGIGYSVTRVPGQLYFLFEAYVIGIFASVVGVLFHGWRTQATEKKRTKNGVLLLAIIPAAVVMTLVIGLLHFEIKWINASVTMPVAISYFLVVSAYGIHHRRFLETYTEADEIADLRAQLAKARDEGAAMVDDNATTPDPKRKMLDDHIAELEARLISQALQSNNGNQAKAARVLGLRPNTLYYKIERYGLSPKKRPR